MTDDVEMWMKKEIYEVPEDLGKYWHMLSESGQFITLAKFAKKSTLYAGLDCSL
jgi:hypothetical protein